VPEHVEAESGEEKHFLSARQRFLRVPNAEGDARSAQATQAGRSGKSKPLRKSVQ
jgi:hypothetical protein